MKEHAFDQPIQVEVFVPAGEELARKTLNARLGILGGISILGTTGVVTPMSHAAYTATIQSALSVARACGQERVVLTTGRRSERFAQYLWPSLSEEAFVQIGDYFKFSLQTAADMSSKNCPWLSFLARLSKCPRGYRTPTQPNRVMSLRTLAQWVRQTCGQTDLAVAVEKANTARQAFDIVRTRCPGVIERVGSRNHYCVPELLPVRQVQVAKHHPRFRRADCLRLRRRTGRGHVNMIPITIIGMGMSLSDLTDRQLVADPKGRYSDRRRKASELFHGRYGPQENDRSQHQRHRRLH